MTWRRGTQWKSTWGVRQRAYGNGDSSLNAWYFNMPAGEGYQQAAAAPFCYQSVPFWAAMMIRTVDKSGIGCDQGAPNGISFFINTVSSPVPGALIGFSILGTSLTVDSSFYVPTIPFGNTVVALVTVNTEAVGQQRVVIWVDGAPRLSALVLGGFVAPGGNAVIGNTGLVAGQIAGFGGGISLPTDDEIVSWFNRVRQFRRMQSIPGKTSNQFIAELNQPNAPAVVTDTGGGQNWNRFGAGAMTNLNLPRISNY